MRGFGLSPQCSIMAMEASPVDAGQSQHARVFGRACDAPALE